MVRRGCRFLVFQIRAEYANGIIIILQFRACHVFFHQKYVINAISFKNSKILWNSRRSNDQNLKDLIAWNSYKILN